MFPREASRSRSPRKSGGDKQSGRTEERDRGASERKRERSRERQRDRDRDRNRKSVDGEREHYRERRHHDDRKRRERGRDDRNERRERDLDCVREQEKTSNYDRERRTRYRDDRRRRRSPSSSSDESLLDIAALGVEPITNEDFFMKAAEFRYYLKSERGKYLDELTSDTAHKYFRRFVRRWNDGALPRDCYLPRSARASDNTRHKWQFAEHRSRMNSDELANVRYDVDRLTHSTRRPPPESLVPSRNESDAEIHVPSRSPTPGPRPTDGDHDMDVGPSLPTQAERQLARELADEAQRSERAAARRAERRTALERAEEIVPRGVGKEGKMAEKRAQNEENKKFREKDTEVELDEGTLMGDSNPFQTALRARDAAAARRAEKKAEQQAEMRSALEERMSERREKEVATMEMFKALAKQRFG